VDVGYGDAIFLQFPNQTTVLIDTGEEPQTAKLIEYLNNLEISNIDTVILTHPHTNHFQGLNSILRNYSVGRVIINGDKNAEEGYFELLQILLEKKIPTEIFWRGQVVYEFEERLKMDVLHPLDLTGTPNGNSIVVRLKHNEVTFLFMGDIEENEQDELLTILEDLKAADCIKIPHHGGPLSDQFIKAFNDKVFIVSTGPNDWENPRLADYKRLKGQVFVTQDLGTIVLESDGKSIKRVQ